MVKEIALSLVQTIGLLLPVVFLLMSFYDDNKNPATDESTEGRFVLLFLMMVFTLTVSAALLLFGLMDSWLSGMFVSLGILGLVMFFLFFGFFILYIAKLVKPAYREDWW